MDNAARSRRRPDVLVFDVIETLADVQVVRDRLDEIGLGADVFPRWFAQLLRDGMALTLTGQYAPFAEVAASSLRSVAGQPVGERQVERVLGGFGEAPPQEDAVPAIRRAADAGCRVFTLSNGAAATTSDLLERAGVAELVDDVLSIDRARAWKPAPATYQLAVDAAGVAPERIGFVAVHSWDIAGARAAGFTTGWCPRLEKAPVPLFGRADVVRSRLDEVVGELVALPR